MLVSLIGFGCASHPRAAQVRATPPVPRYQPATASALAFDTPVTPSYALAGLDRDAREAGAFLGYQDTVTEYFAMGIEDHQTQDPSQDTYDHWTYTSKVGVRYR